MNNRGTLTPDLLRRRGRKSGAGKPPFDDWSAQPTIQGTRTPGSPHRRRCVITRRQPGRRRVVKDAAAAGFHEVTRLARDLLSSRACNSPSATVRSMKGARGRRRPCTYLASHSTRPTKHNPTMHAFLDVLPERLTASLSQLSRRQPPAALCMLDRRAAQSTPGTLTPALSRVREREKDRCLALSRTRERETSSRGGHKSLISRSMDAVFRPCLTTLILLGGPEGPRRSKPITSSWATSFTDPVFDPAAFTLFGSTTSSK
jgi:hypothetical protein